MNNKNLFIIFIALLAVWALSKVFSGKSERSFKTELVALDTASIDRILVYAKADNGEEMTLKREDNGWIATKGAVSTPALQNVVNGLLGGLTQIKTKRVAAKSEEKWTDFEVNEGQGSRLVVYEGSNELTDLIIGRFNFSQATQTASSYVRLNGEDEVYEVDGFLTMSLGSGFNSYRNKQLIKAIKNDITELTFSEGDQLSTLVKVDNQWTLHGSTPMDSTKVDSYLSSLINLSGSDFVDEFDEVASSNLLSRTLTIKANNTTEPTVVYCYVDPSREQPFILNSNLNKNAYFSSDSTGVYQKIFKPISDFQVE